MKKDLTYYDILNVFWLQYPESKLTATDGFVFLHLLAEMNSHRQVKGLQIPNRLMCSKLKITTPTLIASRNKLQQVGYITFEGGNRNKEVPRYTLCLNYFTNIFTNLFTNSFTNLLTNSFTNLNNVYIEKEKEKENISPISPRGDAEAKHAKTSVKAEWRTDIDTYRRELRTEVDSLLADGEWLAKMQTYYPNVDIIRTIDKAVTTYWETEAGWQNKKRKHTNAIDWRRTLTNALAQPQNKVYLINNHYERVTDKYQQSQRACAEAMLEAFGAQLQ